MSRLTTNKNVSEMTMLELAHNSCYADNERRARYRDYELDIDARDLAKMLIKDMCDEDLTGMTDEAFDDHMWEILSVKMDSPIGLIALFYRNLCAMANLREKLKAYEDIGSLEEVRDALEKPKFDREPESCDENTELERYKLALFAVIRNNKVLPKGLVLGKNMNEINKMAKETMNEVLKDLDYERLRNWYEECGKEGDGAD